MKITNKLKEKVQFSLGAKIFILAATLILITSAFQTSLIIQYFNNELINNKTEQLNIETFLQGNQFKSQINELIGDTRFLSSTPPVQGIIRSLNADGIDPYDGSTTEIWRSRLQTIFVEMLESKESYVQIRFIGVSENGKEIVRVDRRGEGDAIRVVSKNNLQKKGHRSYFIKAIQNAADGVYLSEIEYNRENNGEISLPPVPVIRGSIPVFDSDENIFGIIIINKDVSFNFKSLDRYLNEDVYNLTNARGDYLFHNDVNKVFRFEYGESELIQNDYPVLVDAFNTNSEFYEIFSYRFKNGENGLIAFRKINYSIIGGQQYLGIFVKSYNENILAVSYKALKESYLILSVIIFAALIICIIFARRFSRPFMQIAYSINNVSKGEDVNIFPVNDGGIAGILARAFVELLEKIKLREKELLVEVSEREKAERQIAAVLDNAGDAIITIDEVGTILTINKAAENTFGYDSEEVIGQNIKILMPAPYHSEHDEYLKNYKETGNKKIIGIEREVTGLRKDGSIFPMELVVSEVIIGDMKNYTGIARDITLKKEFINTLEKQKEKLEQSNDELERFAYVASHDLQEPLRMVASYTNLLARRYKDKLDDDANDFINYAVDGAKRMQTLINDLLTFSRLNAVSEDFSIINTDDLVEDLLNVLNHSADAKNNVDVTKDKLPIVKGQESLIRQLFQNLITNAMKYSDPDRKNDVHISAKKEDRQWVFSISDTGIGIAPEYFEKIFVIFKRLHGNDAYSGTGIGLALCKKIVEKHGGEIWLESIPDQGTTFRFTLSE